MEIFLYIKLIYYHYKLILLFIIFNKYYVKYFDYKVYIYNFIILPIDKIIKLYSIKKRIKLKKQSLNRIKQ